jgi:hypothetical protein
VTDQALTRRAVEGKTPQGPKPGAHAISPADGGLEIKLREKLEHLRKLDREAMRKTKKT